MTDESPVEILVDADEVNYFPQPIKKGTSKKVLFLSATLLVLLAMLFVVITNLTKAPKDFPTEKEFVVEKGTSLKQIIADAKTEGYIRSELALYIELRLNHSETPIKASTYEFNEPLSLSEFAIKLSEGGKRSDLIKFTHIEGETNVQLARRASEVLVDFDIEKFEALADSQEGLLFPETYLIPADYTAEELFELLKDTFDEKIAEISDEIAASDLSLDEIIILASIIEREANSLESKELVAGILLNRLNIGMALQVDASIGYVLDKPLSELTPEDLDMDSPYNTYMYPGLPPTPISNPGLDSIIAVLNPTPSDYFFYITGDDGNFYYSETFDGHKINVANHLR